MRVSYHLLVVLYVYNLFNMHCVILYRKKYVFAVGQLEDLKVDQRERERFIFMKLEPSINQLKTNVFSPMVYFIHLFYCTDKICRIMFN